MQHSAEERILGTKSFATLVSGRSIIGMEASTRHFLLLEDVDYTSADATEDDHANIAL